MPAEMRERSRAGGDPATAAAEFPWTAHRIAARPSAIWSDPVLAVAHEVMSELTARQRESITRRLALWRGWHGTGKSRTARTYKAAPAGKAVCSGRPLRIAVTGFTWVAIDNVVRGLPALFARVGIEDGVRLNRLASSRTVQGLDPALGRHLTVMGDATDPGRRTHEDRLRRAAGVTVVAGTVH